MRVVTIFTEYFINIISSQFQPNDSNQSNSEKSGLITNEPVYYLDSRVSANSSVVLNTAKNSYPSSDSTKVGYISITQAVDLDTLESDVQKIGRASCRERV